MRLALLAMAAAILLSAGGGCQRHNLVRNGCRSGCGPCMACAQRNREHIPRLPLRQETGPAGPQTASYAYPYYTVRGPRDFLLDNPPTTGR